MNFGTNGDQVKHREREHKVKAVVNLFPTVRNLWDGLDTIIKVLYSSLLIFSAIGVDISGHSAFSGCTRALLPTLGITRISRAGYRNTTSYAVFHDELDVQVALLLSAELSVHG